MSADRPLPLGLESLNVDSSAAALAQRGQRRNEQLEAFFRRAIAERQERFLSSAALDTSSLARYEKSTAELRRRLWQNLNGERGADCWGPRPNDARARLETIGETPAGTLYRANVWIIDDIEMPAMLLVPHSAASHPRPAVICQHGYGGSPEWTFGFGTPGQFNYMNAAGYRLAEAGYIVIAPQIVCSLPGAGKDRTRYDRLARLAGGGLLGFEMFEFSRVVDYLQSRTDVLRDKIGMYGVSQGGVSTLYFAALDTRVRAAVCSCYFNHRANKLIGDEPLGAARQREDIGYLTYLSVDEDDKFNPFSAPLWDDPLLGALICPRAFMAEVGRYDPVIYWRDAVEEFERLKKIYDRLGVGERAALSLSHRGSHEMFFDDARKFLDAFLMGETVVDEPNETMENEK